MKKFFAMAAIALFTMVSCGDDDSTPANNNGGNTDTVLLKRTITTDEDGTVTSIYSYNGNKLTGITHSDGTSDVVTYTGDLITEWKKYTGTTLDENSTYEYNTLGHIVRETYNYGSGEYVYNYTHNGDGTISYSMTGGGMPGTQTGKYYADKLVINGEPTNNWYYSTYDGKNNPRMNITGLNKIFFTLGGDGLNYANNMTTVKRYNDGEVFVGNLYSATYTYNSNNYPLTSLETNHDDLSEVAVQYFYE